MSNSTFEIRWGNGLEAGEQREQARIVVRSALNFVEEGLEAEGVEFDAVKTVKSHLVPVNFARRGDTFSGNTIHLYLSSTTLKNRIPTVRHIASTIFHEAIHCKRGEFADLSTLYEHSVSEGLAYSSEYWFRAHLNPNRHRPTLVEKILSLPKKELKKLKSSYIEAASDPDSWTEEDFKKWQNTDYKKLLSVGEIIGICTIMGYFKEGYVLPELIEEPAEELLGVA